MHKAVSDIDARIKGLKESIAAVEAERTDGAMKVADLKAQHSKLKGERAGITAEIEELSSEREDHERQLAISKWWTNGFGPKGVPAYAIEQSLPVLNEKANRHLVELADGEVHLVLLSLRLSELLPFEVTFLVALLQILVYELVNYSQLFLVWSIAIQELTCCLGLVGSWILSTRIFAFFFVLRISANAS